MEKESFCPVCGKALVYIVSVYMTEEFKFEDYYAVCKNLHLIHVTELREGQNFLVMYGEGRKSETISYFKDSENSAEVLEKVRKVQGE